MKRYQIAILMTCHNRREKTLRCLRTLCAQKLRSGVEVEEWNFHVFLVDDGSTDGTGDAVCGYADELKSRAEAEGRWSIHLVEGDGTLFWARGMALAWREALRFENENLHSSTSTLNINSPLNSPFSHFLWLNDDVVLKPTAIADLLRDWEVCGNADGVIVGATSSDASERTSTYSATDLRDVQFFPNMTAPQRANGWFNGNCVLVPRQTYERIGIIDAAFSHARADYDYAERLKRNGIPFFCSSQFAGVCERDGVAQKSGSIGWRMRMLFRPGYLNLHDMWIYRRRHYGLFRAVISCLHLVKVAVSGW